MKKFIANFLATIGGLTVFVAAFWLLTLTPFWPFPLFDWGYEEFERKASPDGEFDAIVLQGNAGAVSGYQYEIYILPSGSIVDRDRQGRHRVYSSYENSGSFSYDWKQNDLHVSVEETPIDHFWPYYFTQDEKGKRKREGLVFLHFRRQ